MNWAELYSPALHMTTLNPTSPEELFLSCLHATTVNLQYLPVGGTSRLRGNNQQLIQYPDDVSRVVSFTETLLVGTLQG